MANDALGGFDYAYGGGTRGCSFIRKQVASNLSTAIFHGDSVKLVNDGTAVVAAAGNATYSVQLGGSSYVAADGFRRQDPYMPASIVYSGGTTFDAEAAAYINVVTDADFASTTFSVALTGSNTTLTNLENNADIVATAGSTATGQSGFQLDGTTVATTSTLVWRIVNFQRDARNDLTIAGGRVLTTCNVVQEAPFQATGT